MKVHLAAAVLVLLVAVGWCVDVERTIPRRGNVPREFEDRGTLVAGRLKRSEQLVLGSSTGASYNIVGLRPGASYEVRISYPATNPATFTVMFGPSEDEDSDNDDSSAEARSSGSSRSLLNVVQRRFTTPVTISGSDGGRVPLPESSEDGSGLAMFVWAEREGVIAPGVRDSGIVTYNIVVEELVLQQYGGLPGGTLGVAATAVALLVLAAYAATKLRRVLLLRARSTKRH